MRNAILLFLTATGLLAGCASVELIDNGRSMLGETVYTTTNLHPDPLNRRLYAVNYQQAGLIPVCTEVHLDEINDEELFFTAESDGQRYQYIYHRAAAEPWTDHLKRFFSFECPRDEVAGMSAVDRKGIEQGVALPGMSKRGVMIALGYPPRHVNPDPTNSDRWVYWSNRFNRFAVQFDQDARVTQIME